MPSVLGTSGRGVSFHQPNTEDVPMEEEDAVEVGNISSDEDDAGASLYEEKLVREETCVSTCWHMLLGWLDNHPGP